MKLLALDIGDKRIGLATTDELGVAVWPQETILRKELEQDLLKLVDLIKEGSIQGLVVGLPFHADGRESAQAKKIKTFVSQLQKKILQENLQISLEWCDEGLTSWEAEQKLTEKGFKGKKRKAKVDALAACLILEDYLARKPS